MAENNVSSVSLNSSNSTEIDQWTAADIIWNGLFFTISIASIFGNGLTVVAVLRFPSLQTPSNYVITSLAVSDFLQPVGFGIGVLLLTYRTRVCSIYYDILEDVLRSIPIVCSFLHLLLIASDRFIAVMYPLRYHTIFTRRAARNSLVAVWVTATAVSLSFFVWTLVDEDPHHCENYDTPYVHQMSVNGVTYVLVALCLIVMYSKIGLVARKHRRQITSDQVITGVRMTGKIPDIRKTTSVLLYILMAYILTWTPYILLVIATRGMELGTEFDIFSTICLQVGISNCCLNPFVYAWRSKPFHDAYKALLCVACLKRS